MLSMDLRQYDPAIARWVVIDPVDHHEYSPYQAFDNNPVIFADPSGADSESYSAAQHRQRFENGDFSGGLDGVSSGIERINTNSKTNNNTKKEARSEGNGECDENCQKTKIAEKEFKFALAKIRLHNAKLAGASEEEIRRLSKIAGAAGGILVDYRAKIGMEELGLIPTTPGGAVFEEAHRTDNYNEQRGLEDVLYKKHDKTANSANGGLNKKKAIGDKNKNKPKYEEAAKEYIKKSKKERP